MLGQLCLGLTELILRRHQGLIPQAGFPAKRAARTEQEKGHQPCTQRRAKILTQCCLRTGGWVEVSI